MATLGVAGAAGVGAAVGVAAGAAAGAVAAVAVIVGRMLAATCFSQAL